MLPDKVAEQTAGTVNRTRLFGPIGHIVTHFDRDHLPDTVSGRTTAGGRYLIEVHLSPQPHKVTLTVNGLGFAVQDVNADNLADLLVADGLSGRFIQLVHDRNGSFTPHTVSESLYQSGPGPKDSTAATGWQPQPSLEGIQPVLHFLRSGFYLPIPALATNACRYALLAKG